MAVVRPFKGIRPTKELVKEVAALPYDVMNTEEAREMVKGNPYSFLHVDKAQIDLPVETNQYDELVYNTARKTLDKMRSDKTYIQDNVPSMYVYRQIMNGRVQTGIVGCTSIDDYMNDIIKKHEHTRAEKEEDRIKHVDHCNANTGPIFLTYKNVNEIDEIVTKWTSKEPEYNFVSEDGISHIVWVIDDSSTVTRLQELFKSVKYLYIADGHHRAASAVKVGKMRREANPSFTGEEEFNFFLSVIFPADDLYVMDYNRVVKDLNGHSSEEFLNKVAEKFTVEEFKGEGQYRPEGKGSFGMYLDNKWYKLTTIDGTFDSKDPVKSLDVSILQENLLRPLLAIEDPRTSDRIDFVGGIRGLQELERRVAEGMKVAFSMNPTSVEELMNIADAGKVMPPKSTWFEPKLRSGIFVHELS